MSRFWSPVVHNLSPYVAGEQPKIADLIKLNTNENPYGPSPRVLDKLKQSINDDLRLYPDPHGSDLKQTIADYYGVGVTQIFVGNGSDEVLAHIFNALFQHDLPVLFPDITYSFYPVYCKLYQINYHTIPLTEQFEINVADYQQQNGGIIFPNPNAPTSRLLALDEFETLLRSNTESVVVVDEAYIDFGGETAISLIEQYPNLLVTQTLSKSRSLANLRIGFAVGHADLIEALVRVKDSFNSYPMSNLAIVAGIEAFNDHAYFKETCHKIINSRDQLEQALMELGFECLPSKANFIFATHPHHNAEELATKLRKHGIIVRHFRQARIAHFLRITIGTLEQNQQLVNVLKTLIN